MPGRQSTGPPLARKSQPKKSKKQRSLNALAIAEKTVSAGKASRSHRLGESEDRGDSKRRYEQDEESDVDEDERSKRRKRDKIDPDNGNAEAGSDSSGNEWVTGQVDESDDSELDSDDALADSDEDRFEGFTFRGGSGRIAKQTRQEKISTKGRQTNDEDMDWGEANSEGFSGEDDLGEDGVDLADVLDEDQSEASEGGLDDTKEGVHLRLREDDTDKMHLEEASNLSFSDDEKDAQDTRKLAKLQDMVTGLNHTNANINSRNRPVPIESMTPSEFAITSKRKLTLADLEATVTDPGLRKSIQMLAENDSKSSNRKGVPKKLDVPLPKRQQDRIDRTAAYDKTKETLGRWVDTVKHNRRAEHLSFPLPDPDGVVPQGQNRLLPITNAKPVTDLENTIRTIMVESGMIGNDGKPEEDQLRAFEELQTKDMPYEEVLARRAELRQRRDLLFREERRAKRIKKIKSKTYRKIHRKEKERNALSLRNAMIDQDEYDSASDKERNDRQRAEERMGAKHRESRWAKEVRSSGRKKWDEGAREGVLEMARRGEELRRRIEGKTPHEDDDNDESTSENDVTDSENLGGNPLPSRLRKVLNGKDAPDELASEQSSLAGMAFMKRAENARRTQNDADAEALRQDIEGEALESEEEEEATQGAGRKTFGPIKSKTAKTVELSSNSQRGEFEEPAGSDDEIPKKSRRSDVAMDRVVIDAGRNGPKPMESSQAAKLPQVETTAGEWNRAGPTKKTSHHTMKSGSVVAKTSVLPRSALKGGREAAKKLQQGHDETAKDAEVVIADQSSDDGSEDGEPIVMSNAELARRAFAGDDVLDQRFQEEKTELVQEQGDQIIDETLPGWGAWTGMGVSQKQRNRPFRKFRKKQGIAPESRKDAKLKDVIISEKTVKKNGKYLASQLPHPFETKAQYERSLRLPVGPEWTTKETYQDMTKPRILMKQGIIAPMIKPMV